MGTHPIFESDFDCLTEMVEEKFNLLPELKKERYEVTIEDGNWISNKDFNIQDATKDIENFIKKWKLDDAWLFCIDYFGSEEGEFDILHQFNVRFSIPTRQKPIPTATASVYFTLSKSKVKPDSSPIGVEYQVEGSRLNQSPGKLAFRQQWLYDVLKSKNTFLEL